MQETLTIWGQTVPADIFLRAEFDYLLPMINRPLPPIEWIWREMDRVWDHFQLDNQSSLAEQDVGSFYSHPVWILNAFYAAADPETVRHRQSIARYAATLDVRRIADYGGGGAELARQISLVLPNATIEIIEPYPSPLGRYRVKDLENVKFVNKLTGKYDLAIAQDVLEHVENPLSVAEEIAAALGVGGISVYANCFKPVIKCHLPKTFHLRATFRFVIRLGCMKYVGTIDGAEHAQIFRKAGLQDRFPGGVHLAEKLSRVIGPVLNFIADSMKSLKGQR